MSRFLKQTDYSGRIKSELKKMITGATDDTETASQLLAEETAIATIREYIGGRIDCTLLFEADAAATGEPDTRNLFLVKCVIALALFDLYQQTGMQDVPEHRKAAYDDTIQWLKDVGRGTIDTTLPGIDVLVNPGDFRINSRLPSNHKW